MHHCQNTSSVLLTALKLLSLKESNFNLSAESGLVVTQLML
jgi:hypothetical protein